MSVAVPILEMSAPDWPLAHRISSFVAGFPEPIASEIAGAITSGQVAADRNPAVVRLS